MNDKVVSVMNNGQNLNNVQYQNGNVNPINNMNQYNNTNQVNNQMPAPNSNKTKRYKYKAKAPDGEIVESYFDAISRVDVESFLLNKSYQIILIEEDKLSNSLGLAILAKNQKMSMKDLNFFLMQLSTYVKSGIPLVDSMEILSRQVKKNSVKMLYRKIVFELNRGVAFSECLEKQGKVFPKMLINMLKTSEMTGNLTGVLDDMAGYYKRQDTNRKQIINAMIYPSVLMIFAIGVLTFVITYVVPSFTKMYETAGSDIPTITKTIMNISNFVIGNWLLLLLGVVVVVSIFAALYKNVTGFRYYVQFFMMHIPVIKDIIKYNQLITFTSTFATLIKHDVFITDSMAILSKITDNLIYKEIINSAINNLSKGNGVSVAFKGHWAFPETAYEMLVTGEKTGKLGDMMYHVSEFYQEEQTNIIARMKSLIEPIMIVLLAALVGVILLAVVVPMFDIYSKII